MNERILCDCLCDAPMKPKLQPWKVVCLSIVSLIGLIGLVALLIGGTP